MLDAPAHVTLEINTNKNNQNSQASSAAMYMHIRYSKYNDTAPIFFRHYRVKVVRGPPFFFQKKYQLKRLPLHPRISEDLVVGMKMRICNSLPVKS